MRRLPAAQHEVFFKVLDFEGNFMSRQDATGHARLRRISSRAFTARRIEMLRERGVKGYWDVFVRRMKAGELGSMPVLLAASKFSEK